MTWHPDTPLHFRDQIVTGDARELARLIPDCSVDLVFTDPVYDRIEDYEWLAETAVRVLKPDSACLVFAGIGYLPEVLQALRAGGLRYRWQFAVMQLDGPTCPSKRFFWRGFNKWHTCLWLEKGESLPVAHISDMVISKRQHWDNGHEWKKSNASYEHWLGRFTHNGAIVYDPFTGGGTVPAVCKMLGRHWIASEIDPDVAERARKRVEQTQPPLFVLSEEQATMELTA